MEYSDYLMHPWEEREKLAMVEGGKNEVKCIIQGEGGMYCELETKKISVELEER